MSLVEFIDANAPVANLPELFNMHHSNPLGIPVLAQLFIILALSAVMFYVNIRISYHDKQKLYPTLYTLLGLTLVACYYYCFIAVNFTQ